MLLYFCQVNFLICICVMCIGDLFSLEKSVLRVFTKVSGHVLKLTVWWQQHMLSGTHAQNKRWVAANPSGFGLHVPTWSVLADAIYTMHSTLEHSAFFCAFSMELILIYVYTIHIQPICACCVHVSRAANMHVKIFDITAWFRIDVFHILK